jgi:hypothetical protein
VIQFDKIELHFLRIYYILNLNTWLYILKLLFICSNTMFQSKYQFAVCLMSNAKIHATFTTILMPDLNQLLFFHPKRGLNVSIVSSRPYCLHLCILLFFFITCRVFVHIIRFIKKESFTSITTTTTKIMKIIKYKMILCMLFLFYKKKNIIILKIERFSNNFSYYY